MFSCSASCNEVSIPGLGKVQRGFLEGRLSFKQDQRYYCSLQYLLNLWILEISLGDYMGVQGSRD